MSDKKKKKTLWAIIIGIILVLIVSILIYVIANKKENNNDLTDDSIVHFKVKDIKCLKDQEIDVEIELLDDSNFVAANFEYKYDTTNLEYINYEIGKTLENICDCNYKNAE